MPNKNLTEHPEFQQLQAHGKDVQKLRMTDLFASDPHRFEKFHAAMPGLLLDYSRNHITGQTLAHLLQLAQACGVESWRDRMFAGEALNTSENRAVLHAALRGSVNKNLTVNNENVSAFVDDTLDRIRAFTEKIRHRGKITDVVNIGIGGSDLGPRAVYEALKPFADGPRIHFLANIDGAAVHALLETLDPKTTFFIVVSKTFTTLETLTNAQTAKDWLTRRHQNAENQFAAVTESPQPAEAFSIRPENILPMRPWIGGRFSVWSAAGIAVSIGLGFENFEKLLSGAHAMDEHFKTAPLEKNIPVLLALLGVWYRNCFDYRAHAIIPYAQGLQEFPAWLQQLDMESNGKRVSRNGQTLDYVTSPVIFGEPGTNAQHAFFQMLHQGTDIVPCDFIVTAAPEHSLSHHHAQLNANALAQAKALMDGQENKAEPHRAYPGNRPSNMIVLDRLDAFHTGMLFALYEHKIFVQGVLWNINSFDQWGVELGKQLSKGIMQALENPDGRNGFDSSTTGVLAYLKEKA